MDTRISFLYFRLMTTRILGIAYLIHFQLRCNISWKQVNGQLTDCQKYIVNIQKLNKDFDGFYIIQ